MKSNMNTKHVTLYPKTWASKVKKYILVGSVHRILLLGIYRDGKYSWNCFLSKTKDDEWSRGKYFRKYIFFYIWCVSNAWYSFKTNNGTIIIIFVRSLLLLQMKNWSTSFPFFPLFWNSRIVSWWNVTNNFPLGVCSIFKQFCLYFLQR